MLYRQSPITSVGAFLASLLVAIVMWGIVSPAVVLTWLLTLNVAQAARVLVYYRYQRSAPSEAEAGKWANYYMWTMFAAGICWAVGSIVLFVPGELEYQAWLTMVMFGLAAGSVSATSSDLRIMCGFLVLVLVPVAARTMIEGGLPQIVMATFDVVLLVTLALFGRNQNHSVVDSIRTRFENMSLIEELKAEKTAADGAREQAIEASRAKSQFFAAASHDLRQPLHALGLFSSALKGEHPGPAQDRVVSNINNAIETLEEMFNKLLDISKLDAGFVEPHVLSFPVQMVLDRVAATFAPAAAEKNLELQFDESKALVVSDPTLLERIVGNLVSNAIRYTPRGGRVSVSCQERGDGYCLEVADTGIGIPVDEQQRVFDEFYQIGNPERDRKKGLGLGLAIVKRLTGLLRHRLSMESAPKRGTIFSLQLPRGSVDESATAQEDSAVEVPNMTLKGRFIVVIDDERAVREGMQLLLKQWNCEVLAAGSSQEALKALAMNGRRPDLLIVDYRLREGYTGTQAIETLNAFLGETVPAVLITGDTAPDRLQEAKASGYYLIHKPVRPSRLRTLVTRVLGGKA
jgi:signal transduction histidine kinase